MCFTLMKGDIIFTCKRCMRPYIKDEVKMKFIMNNRLRYCRKCIYWYIDRMFHNMIVIDLSKNLY